MRIPFTVGAPHRLLALFLLATIVPSAALVWLGWQLLEQDRRLERQRIQDVLESTANRVSAGIERELQSIERELPSLSTPSNGTLAGSGSAVAVRLTHSGIAAHAGSPLPYQPTPRTSPPEPGGAVWTDAESLEFARRDADGAVRAYRAIAQSSDANTRAGALVRLARAQKTARRDDQALETYTTLATLTTATINGDPADLMARWARVRLLDALGRQEARQAEATALVRDLEDGRWPVDRTTFQAYTRELAPVTDGASAPNIAERWVLSEAVVRAWDDWRILEPRRFPRARQHVHVEHQSIVGARQPAVGKQLAVERQEGGQRRTLVSLVPAYPGEFTRTRPQPF